MLTAPTAYFGFYWGSPDSYNSVELWNGSTRLATFSGTDLATRTGVTFGGDQSVGTYVNIRAGNSGELFNQVQFSSNGINAFETDNLAAAVPEPETYALMLAGLGLLGLMARRRKQNDAAV